jgi:hypothetical protein
MFVSGLTGLDPVHEFCDLHRGMTNRFPGSFSIIRAR